MDETGAMFKRPRHLQTFKFKTMSNLKHLLFILSALESEEFEAFMSNYNLKNCQDILGFILEYCLEHKNINEVINEVELNSPSLNFWNE